MEFFQLADRLRLTVITDEVLARPRALSDVIREALAAGAPTIQLRLKDATGRELLEAAHTLIPIVRSASAILIVNDRLDVDLPEDPYDTLGGFVFGALNRVGSVGDVIEYEGGRLRITKMRGRRVEFVMLVPDDPPQPT